MSLFGPCGPCQHERIQTYPDGRQWCLGCGRWVNETLGQTIRFERRRAKLTLREVSRRSGVSLSYISDLERGRQHGECSVRTVACIASAIGRLDAGREIFAHFERVWDEAWNETARREWAPGLEGEKADER